MWARAKVEKLQRELWQGPNKEVTQSITNLGIEYGLVTPYTSFVAVDSSRRDGNANPTLIDQAVYAPEGVNPQMAGARMRKSSRQSLSIPGATGCRGPCPQASFSGRHVQKGSHIGRRRPTPALSLEDVEEESDAMVPPLHEPLTQKIKALRPAMSVRRVLEQAKNRLPKAFLSLLKERPTYFRGAKARLRVDASGRVLEVELVADGPLHDRRYGPVRRFFRSLKFSKRQKGGEIWIEFALDSPFLR